MPFRLFFSLSALLLLVGCQTTAPAFDFGAYSEAERFYEKGEYAKAIQKYQEYTKEHEEGNMVVISYYYMARSYEGLGQNGEARALYEKIVAKYPDLIWTDFAKMRLQELESAS